MRIEVTLFRDDGPLGRALGAALGRAVPLWPVALIALGLLPGLAAVVTEGDGASDGLAAACVAWLVLLGGIASGRPHTDRLRWLVPSLLRLGEYGGVLWLAAIAGRSSLPAAFALLGVVAFRQYDLVYRARTQGTTPPWWTTIVSLGWEGRLIVTWALLALGALPAGLYALAAILAVVLVGESVACWIRFTRTVRADDVYEDEEDEAA